MVWLKRGALVLVLLVALGLAGFFTLAPGIIGKQRNAVVPHDPYPVSDAARALHEGLVVGDLHLAKTLFGSVLTVVILLYLVALPLLYPRGGWVMRWADRLAVPVPWLKHAVIAILASIVIALIDVHRKWEVYELIFSLLVVSIFLIPQNREKLS